MTKRKRGDHLRELHTYRNPGKPCPDPDFRPRIHGNPEETLAAAFIREGQDYGGPLPADFVLHAVLQSGPAQSAAATQPWIDEGISRATYYRR